MTVHLASLVIAISTSPLARPSRTPIDQAQASRICKIGATPPTTPCASHSLATAHGRLLTICASHRLCDLYRASAQNPSMRPTPRHHAASDNDRRRQTSNASTVAHAPHHLSCLALTLFFPPLCLSFSSRISPHLSAPVASIPVAAAPINPTTAPSPRPSLPGLNLHHDAITHQHKTRPRPATSPQHLPQAEVFSARAPPAPGCFGNT